MSRHRSTRSARRTMTALAATAVLAAAAPAALAAPLASPATTPGVTAARCAVTWGSLAKTSSRTSTADLTNVRAGQHECYDRLVVDLDGPATGYTVRYVSTVYAEGSGDVVPLRGGAKLLVVVKAPAYDDDGNSTYTPRNRAELVSVGGYRTFRQVAWAGSFEGQTSMGLGVRARLPFRVFTLAGPGSGSRVVIDVAHTW
jgi:hypothetical protein